MKKAVHSQFVPGTGLFGAEVACASAHSKVGGWTIPRVLAATLLQIASASGYVRLCSQPW